MAVNINIPHNFTCRPYQKEIFEADNSGVKNILLIRARRLGKDKTLLNIGVKKTVKKVANFYYVFPEYEQGRKIFWNGIDNDGFRNIDHFPNEIIKMGDQGQKGDKQKMTLELVNGSIFQVVGTDKKIDNIVGTNPQHLIMSEYAIQNPLGRKLLSPIVKMNGGSAHFCYTPRGKNHGWRLYQYAKNNPNRFVSVVKAYEAYDNKGNRIITDEELEEIRKEYIADGDLETFEQEYLCSFEGSIKGAYYGEQLRELERQGRICAIPYEPNLKTYTIRDLGMDDSTTIRFVQILGKEVRFIDYYENNGQGLDHYIEVIKERGYNYAMHYLPHDANVRELGTGISRVEYFRKMNIRNIEVLGKQSIQDGIDAVRRILKYCRFDKDKTDVGVDALKSYHKQYNEKLGKYQDKPVHDRTSHAADGIRYFSQVYEKLTKMQGYGPSITTINKGNFYI